MTTLFNNKSGVFTLGQKAFPFSSLKTPVFKANKLPAAKGAANSIGKLAANKE